MLVIEFENVSKLYSIRTVGYGTIRDRLVSLLDFRGRRNGREEFLALDDVSFGVERGETVGLVGPNGSGKSTALKLLAGVVTPTRGRVTVSGKLQALIELGAGFHQELSGRENVHLYASIIGMKRREIDAKFDRIVGFSGLEQFIDTPIKHYSSGMIVRLGFAVAAHMEPEILLVDEVLSVGDAAFQQKCMDKIEEFRSEGRTMIVVSHSRAVIEKLCERVLLLQRGKIVAQGPPSQVLDISHRTAGAMARPATLTPGLISITEVELLDANGQAKRVFHPREQARLRIRFRTTARVEGPVFSMSIYRGTEAIHGTNTGSFGLRPTYEAGVGGCVEVEYQALNLLRGRYRIEVGIFAGPEGQMLHDACEHAVEFSMESSGRDGRGLVYQEHGWHLETHAAPRDA